MLRVILNGRTVSCGNLKKVGNTDTEVITFQVASDRSYTRTVVDEEGNESKVRDSDFMYCVAYGSKAKIVNEFCNLYNEEGRFISRPVYIEGRLETFSQDKEVTMSEIVQIAGKKTRVTLTKTVKQYGTKLIIDTINFLSANPVNIAKPTGETLVKSVEILDDDNIEVVESNSNEVGSLEEKKIVDIEEHEQEQEFDNDYVESDK